MTPVLVLVLATSLLFVGLMLWCFAHVLAGALPRGDMVTRMGSRLTIIVGSLSGAEAFTSAVAGWLA